MRTRDRTKRIREAKKDYYGPAKAKSRRQKVATRDQIEVGGRILWTNFLWSDSTRALVAAVINRIVWSALPPNGYVAFLNLGLSKVCFLRMTPAGIPIAFHYELVLPLETSLIDISKALKRPVKGFPVMRKQDLVGVLEKSRSTIDDLLSRKAA